MADSLISPEIESVLNVHGIPTDPHVDILGCPEAEAAVESLVGEPRMKVHKSVEEVTTSAKGHRLTSVIVGVEHSDALLRSLSTRNVIVGVIVYEPDGDKSSASALRSAGAVGTIQELTPGALVELLQRAMLLRALHALELAHRCESRRLLDRELELLGHPPEGMSDDLNTNQPPPLPVGPMSVYNLEEASETFERAYIDRVQQLCTSAREAAQYLAVSSATLSRRLRKESTPGGA